MVCGAQSISPSSSRKTLKTTWDWSSTSGKTAPWAWSHWERKFLGLCGFDFY